LNFLNKRFLEILYLFFEVLLQLVLTIGDVFNSQTCFILTCLDLFRLSTDKLLQRLNESFPFIVFLLHFGLGGEDQAIIVLERSHIVVVKKALTVEVTNQSVLVDDLLVHHVFVRLSDDSNQEVH
jgi:hypothetical protein